MAGVDIRTVQELLDHKTSAVTMRCAHLAPKHTLAAVISVRMLNYPGVRVVSVERSVRASRRS